MYGTYAVLIHLCEVDGKIPFSSTGMFVVVEFTKVGVKQDLKISLFF